MYSIGTLRMGVGAAVGTVVGGLQDHESIGLTRRRILMLPDEGAVPG
jgi:hypothetical protein